jgi:hypothetical protein
MAEILRMPYTALVTNLGELRLSIYNPATEELLYAGGNEMSVITVYQDDHGYDLLFEVMDSDGNPFNLNGFSVKWRTALPQATELTVNGACAIVSAGEGRCAYTTQEEDFEVPGIYRAELFLHDADNNKKYRIRDMEVHVRAKLPEPTEE